MKKYIWSNVNDKKDCVEYLKLLNNTINNLFELDNFVLRNIFNPSTNVREDDIPDFCDIACVLERYRNILVGDSLHWNDLIPIIEKATMDED